MDAILDAVQDVVAAEPEVGAQPDNGTTEARLAQEISELWSSHVRLSGTRRATSKELRQIRARLSERLHAMKSLLARPGRGGEWRGWLRERRIPRSTADRLVARYAETLGIENGNAPTGAIPDPPEDSAERLARSVWQRFRKILATDDSVFRFIGCMAEISGVGHEQRAEGLVIFNPVPKAADEVLASAPETGAAPQPSGEAPAAVEEPAAEVAATPTESGQAAAAADAGSGGVA
jgi:hypothetical protein